MRSMIYWGLALTFLFFSCYEAKEKTKLDMLEERMNGIPKKEISNEELTTLIDAIVKRESSIFATEKGSNSPLHVSAFNANAAVIMLKPSKRVLMDISTRAKVIYINFPPKGWSFEILCSDSSAIDVIDAKNNDRENAIPLLFQFVIRDTLYYAQTKGIFFKAPKEIIDSLTGLEVYLSYDSKYKL